MMKAISYQRTEFHRKNKLVENPLLGFVYAIPYFGACGIFPPLHIANHIFLSGGGDGGMGPGAIWEPFKITKKEYQELVGVVKSTPPRLLKGQARYIDLPFQFDTEFDYIKDRMDWIAAVCDKLREEYQ